MNENDLRELYPQAKTQEDLEKAMQDEIEELEAVSKLHSLLASEGIML